MKKTVSHMKSNVGLLDRYIRIFLGVSALSAGFFWLSGIAQVISFVIAIAAIATGLFAYCGLYTMCNTSTCNVSKGKHATPKETVFLVLFLILLFAIESAASVFITRKKFLENFNHMNGFYKQTLFLTGQLKRDEAIAQYDLLSSAYADFFETYAGYRPFVLRQDARFTQDLNTVQQIVRSVKDGVYTGDLAKTHKDLEVVRPIFQEMFKRNGFSMASMALVDFHDLMETLITAADAKDAAGVLSAYTPASEALKIVESEDTSEDVLAIRDSLEVLRSMASEGQSDQLSASAAALKKTFIKVYLLKG